MMREMSYCMSKMHCGVLKVFVVVLLQVALSLGAGGQENEGTVKWTEAPGGDALRDSCIQGIDVDPVCVNIHSSYHFKIKLTNESLCSVGRTNWPVEVVECGQNRTLITYIFGKTEGYLVPKAKCQRFKVGGQYSSPLYTSEDAPDILVVFHKFDTSGLHLAIRSDERVRSWNLSILDCRESPKCFMKKVIAHAGNQSVLYINENFKQNMCYGFMLQPNAFGTCRLRIAEDVITPPSGCHPQSIQAVQIPKLVIDKGHSWWMVPLISTVAVVCVVCIALIVSAVRKHLRNKALSTGIGMCSVVTQEEAARHKPPVLVLYAQDSETHVAMVTQLIVWLRKDLCQVFDIFDEGNIEKLSNPSCWLEEIISTACLKVVVVVSPHMTDYFQALIASHVDALVKRMW